MSPSVNSSEARQHQEHIEDAVETAGAAALIAAKQISETLRAVLDKLREGKSLDQNDPDIEIRIGRNQPVLSHKNGVTQVNKLNPAQLKAIESAIASPNPATRSGSQRPGAIRISLDGQAVYHRDGNGVTQISLLDQAAKSAQAETAKAPQAAKTAPDPAQAPEETRSTATTEVASNQPTPTVKAEPQVAAQVPESAAPKTITVEQIQDQVKQLQSRIQSISNTIDKHVLPRIANERTKNWVNSAVSAAKEAPSQLKTAVATTASKTANWMQQQSVASTNRTMAKIAVQLLDRFGSRQHDGTVAYRAADYKIQYHGKNDFSVTDTQGNSLLQFKKTALGIQVDPAAKLDRYHTRDFLKAHQKLQGADLSTPRARHEQLGPLAPRGDREAVEFSRAIEFEDNARKVLQIQGHREPDGRAYAYAGRYQFQEHPRSPGEPSHVSVVNRETYDLLFNGSDGFTPHCNQQDQENVKYIADRLESVQQSPTPAETETRLRESQKREQTAPEPEMAEMEF